MPESNSAHQKLHRAVRGAMMADAVLSRTLTSDAGWSRIQASWMSAKQNGKATPWDGLPGFLQASPNWGQVDIYLSAGPAERDAAGHIIRSCTRDSVVNCSLWRIRWDFAARWFTEIELVRAAQEKVSDTWCTGGVGYFMPAVSPSGRGVAYVAACYENQAGLDYHARSVIEVQDHDPWTFVRGVAGGSDSYTRPTYPNWYDDTTLLFERTGDGSSNKDWRHTLWQASSWPDFTSLTATAGPGSGNQDEESYADPNTTADSIDRPGMGQRVVTFGGAQTTLPHGGFYTQRVPRTSTRYGGDVEEAVLPADWATPAQSAECHHPAWNVSGDEILCTRYQSPEIITGGDSDQDARRLWVLSWDGTSWGNAQPLVGLLTRIGFNETSKDPFQLLVNNVFPPRTGPIGSDAVCADYVWKFGEWCGSNRYVVATLYCTNDAFPPPVGEGDDAQGVDVEVLSSRVMLIDLMNDDDAGMGTPDAYVDLVSFLEYIEGAVPGSWHGWFATCTPVETWP